MRVANIFGGIAFGVVACMDRVAVRREVLAEMHGSLCLLWSSLMLSGFVRF